MRYDEHVELLMIYHKMGAGLEITKEELQRAVFLLLQSYAEKSAE